MISASARCLFRLGLFCICLSSAACKKDVQRPVPPPAPLAPTHPVFFVADFESGSVSGFDLSWLANRWAAKVVGEKARAGKRALEISLRRRDKMQSKGKRAELLVPYTYRHGKGYWYGFSVYLPQAWEEDDRGEVVAQFFANEDKELGEKGRSPALALRINKRFWYVTSRWDERVVTAKNSAPKAKLYKARYQRGRWTDWVFHVRWAWKKGLPPAEAGLVEVWRDGRKVVERRGPNTYNDRRGPSLKLGIYKAPWNDPDEPSAVSERRLFLDEIRVGTEAAGYAGVAPAGRSGGPASRPARPSGRRIGESP